MDNDYIVLALNLSIILILLFYYMIVFTMWYGQHPTQGRMPFQTVP